MVPGVALRITFCDTEQYIVASNRLDARLTPCQLRSALLTEQRIGRQTLTGSVATIEVVGGLNDIGGGLYQRRHPGGADERWFSTLLSHERITALFSECPVDLPHGSISVVAKPDLELGVAVVQLTSEHCAVASRIDELAAWAMGACLVEELLDGVTESANRCP